MSEFKFDPSYNDLNELKRRGFGWISPEGLLIPCDLHNHFQAMAQHAPYKEWVEHIMALEEEKDEDYRRFEERLDPDEHPAWHVFSSDAENEMGNQRLRLATRLYMDGWVRLGCFDRGAGKLLETEAGASVLKRHRGDLEYLAAMLGRDVVLTEVRWFHHSWRSVPVPHEEVRAVAPEEYDQWRSYFSRSKISHRMRWQTVELRGVWSAPVDSIPAERLEARLPSMLRWSVNVHLRGVELMQVEREAGPPPSLLADAVDWYVPDPPPASALRRPEGISRHW